MVMSWVWTGMVLLSCAAALIQGNGSALAASIPAGSQAGLELAVSLAGRVRFNSISPGWIDTDYTVYEGPDAIQQPAGRVGSPLDIAHMALFLASEKAGFITGENICIDGGQTRLMIYHGDHGWTLTP